MLMMSLDPPPDVPCPLGLGVFSGLASWYELPHVNPFWKAGVRNVYMSLPKNTPGEIPSFVCNARASTTCVAAFGPTELSGKENEQPSWHLTFAYSRNELPTF